MGLLSLFRRERSAAAAAEREEQLERAVTDGLRTLSRLLKKTADVIETRRLERKGFRPQERFLERADKKQP